MGKTSWFDGYCSLARIFSEAVRQASVGKGKERHAEEHEDFEDQIILEITRRLEKSPVGYPLGQAVKKIYETVRLDKEAGINELYGALNYVAAAIIRLKELKIREGSQNEQKQI